MSLIANCLARLVSVGRISEKAAMDALALAEGAQGRLYPNMPPASAEAASALEAARVMAEAAREKKMKIAMQAIRDSENQERISRHPKGKVAGLMGILTRDIWEAPEAAGLNIDSHQEAVLGAIFREAGKFLEPYRSRAAGLLQDSAGVRDVIRENFGLDTGDAVAKEASRSWMAAVDYAVKRAKAAGIAFRVLEDWRQPQFWEASRVRGARTAFIDEVLAAHSAGKLRIIDAETGENATLGRALVIAEKAADDITAGRGQAGGGTFSPEMRVFRFDDPETWLTFADRYGAGRGNVYSMMSGHLSGMAREIGLAEILGPDHGANFARLLDAARAEEGKLSTRQRVRARRVFGIETAAAAQRTYDLQSGKLGTPASEMMAGIFGGLRSLRASAALGSAIISAVPGDSVTAMWAANHLGIPATAVIARAARDILHDTKHKRELAAQIDIVAHAVMDAAIGSKRFDDQIVGENLPGRLAAFVIRAQGLQAWTEGLKRAFSMEFSGYAARQAASRWDAVDAPFRRFLERNGFTPADWDVLRKTPALEANGARFFDMEGVADKKLRDRLMSAMLDERRFAVIEPDSRIRQLTTAGLPRGSFVGELARSASLFKSFGMTVITTHLMRYALTGPVWARPVKLAAFLTSMTVAGAASMQAKSILFGRDPQDMSDPRFWLAAAAQGGGGGIYGDLLYSGTTREGFGISETLTGPILGELVGLADAAMSTPRKLAAGEKVSFGRGLAQFTKRWTPGASLWYSRVAADRLIFDQIYALLDPKGEKQAARRIEKYYRKEFGQEFWWSPGTTSPQRSPRLSAMAP
jgi:hypothetical protein